MYVPGSQWASQSSGQHSGSQHHMRMACLNSQTDLWSQIETVALCAKRDPINRKTKQIFEFEGSIKSCETFYNRSCHIRFDTKI